MILKCEKPQKGASCCRKPRDHSGRPSRCNWERILGLGAAPINMPSGPKTGLASYPWSADAWSAGAALLWTVRASAAEAIKAAAPTTAERSLILRDIIYYLV